MTDTSNTQIPQKLPTPTCEHTLGVERAKMLTELHTQLIRDSEHNQTGLILIDIREFRELNRSFGEACGDSILNAIAARLKEIATDIYTVFYLGNDEFGIVLRELKSPGFAVIAVDQILASFKRVFEWDNHTLKITVNCGVAYNYDSHIDSCRILYDAETALKKAIALNQPFQLLGKNEQAEVDQLKWQLLNNLHTAIQDENLSLYYQPKCCLQQSLAVKNKFHHGAEALIRWETIEHGIIAPNTTIPLIEHLGSEADLIRWLINSTLKKLSEESTFAPNNSISINVPAASITTKVLYQIIEEAFSLWDVEPRRLTLEITEDVLIRDKELAFDYLSKLRETGVRISIDDFGTGYSSLAYFKHIPADELKIDRAFIGSMLTDQGSKNIVKLIIDLAHSFDLDVVAEGVEDQATLDELTRMGCDYAQGFFIGKPMPAEQYTEWLKKTAVK